MRKNIKNKIIAFSLTFMMLSMACIQDVSLANVEKQVVTGEKVKDFKKGSLYKVKEKGKVKDVIVYDNGTVEDYLSSKHGSYFKSSKVSKQLDELIQEDGNQKLPVAIWFNDIDYSSIEKKAKLQAEIDEFNEADSEKIQKYIEVKRELAKTLYTPLNKKYYSKYIPNEDVIFMSSYSPFIIANIQVKKIEKLGENDDITFFELVNDTKKLEETVNSNSNINVPYTQDRMGLTGSGIKVGILEMYYADKSNAQLSDRNIIFDVTDAAASADIGTHATKITSIIVGNTEGIIPDATIYMAAAKNRIQDYEKIEWLVSQGVDVINYSAGYSTGAGVYSDMAKWIDHLSFQHNLLFVKSAGNGGSTSYITDPGMAYNAITIGSIYDNDSSNEPDWTDDRFSTYSSFLETQGGYKPDLSAPGEGIKVAGYNDSNGTSYSAAHVTAVIAQIIQHKPDLGAYPSALNALLKAGTKHRTATDYNVYTLISNYSNMEGAGVIDAMGAYDTADANNYMQTQLDNSAFPYMKPITVDSTSRSMRIVLNWQKQNTLLSDGSVSVRELSDMDLYVLDPNGSIVGSSNSANNNTELVEFTPTIAGNYTILVDGYILENDYEVFGLAWYQ